MEAQRVSLAFPGALSRTAGMAGTLRVRTAKRTFDIVFSLIILVLSAPLLAIAALALRLESQGPAIFRQRRMGRNGRVFELVKLRGMYVDARERFPELYAYDDFPEANTCYFHLEDDPRVTRVARILRKYSIDELPNFWNVLRGEMSVVGPRPEIPELAHLYGAHLERVLSVRPGVTSPAKAGSRDTLSLEETIVFDLQYIAAMSFLLDVATILRTIVGVVRGNGR